MKSITKEFSGVKVLDNVNLKVERGEIHALIGGASAYRGSGSVGGVIIGALLLGVINMGMSILGITDSWQYVVKGVVLLVAVIFDVVSKRRNQSK